MSVNEVNPFHGMECQRPYDVSRLRQISFNDQELALPESVSKDMGTFGNFSYLFEDDPEWEEGLKEDEWIVDNIDWLSQCFIDNDIPVEEEFFRWFYQAVNVADWRCSSCGGCI